MEKYYVLERFSLMKSSVLSAIDSMTVKRKAIEKNQKSNNNRRQYKRWWIGNKSGTSNS